MGYPKYEEDNRKLLQERQSTYGYFQEETPCQEEYIPYAVKYQLLQPKAEPRKKRSFLYSY